jgi:N-acylneuraminate cytidylyltransferase
MIGNQRILGLIPARGGSVELPRKNVLPLAGKPLIAWTINAALESKYLDRIVLSSDDDEIIQVAKAWGCEAPFRRPAHLAAADSPTIDAVLHALRELTGFDYLVLLQPTSPLRTSIDIDRALEKCIGEQAPTCASVVYVEKPPHWMYYLDAGQRLKPVLPGAETVKQRQDVARVCALNGAIYVSHVDTLQVTQRLVNDATVGYVMPPDRSVDVDTEFDLRWCEFLLRQARQSDRACVEGAT